MADGPPLAPLEEAAPDPRREVVPMLARELGVRVAPSHRPRQPADDEPSSSDEEPEPEPEPEPAAGSDTETSDEEGAAGEGEQGEEEGEEDPATVGGALWKHVKYGAWVAWDGLEFVGEVCADFLGLNDSQYQWIIDEHNRREADVRPPRAPLRPWADFLTGTDTVSPSLVVRQRKRRLRRLRALKAAREAREIADMEGGGADAKRAAEGGQPAEAEEESSADENDRLLGP